MNRRTALQLLLGSAMATGLRTVTATGSKPRWKTAFGLNGFMSSARKYDLNFPIWEVLEYASKIGFEGVELVNGWPQGHYPASTESEKIRALKGMYDRYGLQVFSIQTGAAGAFAPKSEDRKKWLSQMRDHLRFAKSAVCDGVGMWPGGGLRGQSIDVAIKHLAASLREVSKMADDFALISAFEIEPPFVFNTEAHLKQILEEANDPRVKTIYDPSHFDLFNDSTGNPHELLKRIGVEHIGYIHFTDTDGTIRDGGTSKHLPAGDGHIDIAATFKTLRDGGFTGWVMVDPWQIPNPYNACTKGLQAIKEGMI